MSEWNNIYLGLRCTRVWCMCTDKNVQQSHHRTCDQYNPSLSSALVVPGSTWPNRRASHQPQLSFSDEPPFMAVRLNKDNQNRRLFLLLELCGARSAVFATKVCIKTHLNARLRAFCIVLRWSVVPFKTISICAVGRSF